MAERLSLAPRPIKLHGDCHQSGNTSHCRIRLPDAIIWATADVGGLLLVTRNTRDFDASNPGICIPYTL